MAFWMTLLALALLARLCYLQTTLAHFELLRRSNSSWFQIELRRHAMLARDDGDLQEFPGPREVRVLALRIAGIPVWRQLRSVGLPPQLDARIDQLRAEESDALFDGGFRLRA